MDTKEVIQLSKEALIQNFKIINGRNLYWTIDKDIELPTVMQPNDDVPPRTIPEVFKQIKQKRPLNIALKVKRQHNAAETKLRYIKWSWDRYYQECMQFAMSLIKIGVQERKSVNIIGFNSPEWAITFFGSIFANCIPSGVYTTNNTDACLYQAEHSDAQIIVCENEEYLNKYLTFKAKLPQIIAFVIYDDNAGRLRTKNALYQQYIYGWKEFLQLGQTHNEEANLRQQVKKRIAKQSPGNCCNLVYTSGTTGPPKGVMLSHDNMLYNMTITYHALIKEINWNDEGQERMVSYLPLSHSAAQCSDLLLPMIGSATLTFAKPDALQGSIIETLKDVRPTIFFSVPRVWEKFEEKLREIGKSKPPFAQAIANWAKSKGLQATQARQTVSGDGQEIPPTPWTFPVAQTLILNRIKSAMGLDQTRIYAYAAAPMSKKTQDYFCSLDMPPINIYGMTESSGAVTTWSAKKAKMYTCGFTIPGMHIKIDNPDKDGQGEICMKGRSVFMGYYKDEHSTQSMFDSDGYIHSGDLGIMKDGFLEVTGRIKEIIITAGGENIAPVLLEDNFKEVCPVCSNIIVIGDYRKFLSAIITLKVVHTDYNMPTQELTNECKAILKEEIDEDLSTVEDCLRSEKFKKYIDDCFSQANQKAISRAQHIRKWYLARNDFSIEGGEFTPSLKMRRKVIEQKYKAHIDVLYEEPKL